MIKDYPPEAYDIKCMEDTWEYLKTENAVSKFEGYIRGWMKQIQELLLESEQLRLETDDAGPQVRGGSLMTSRKWVEGAGGATLL